MPSLQLIYRYSISGIQSQNTYWATGDTLDASDLQAFADYVQDAYVDFVQPLWQATVTSLAAQGRNASIAGSPFIPLPLATLTGPLNADLLSPRQCLLIQWRNPNPAPNLKRVYIGGFTEQNNTAGSPSGGIVTQLSLFAERLTDLVTLNGKSCEFSVVRMLGSPPVAQFSRALTTYQVFAAWADLRSRRN